MKKTNNISKIISGLIVAGVIGGVVYFNQKDNTNSQPVIAEPVSVVEKAPIQAVLNMEIEKPFTLQIFYTTSVQDNFNEPQSVRKNVTPDDNEVIVELPVDVNEVQKFRVDFGSEPGKVIVKNVKIGGEQKIALTDWEQYHFINIDEHSVNQEDNSLIVNASHKDPYIVFKKPIKVTKETALIVQPKVDPKAIEEAQNAQSKVNAENN